MVTKLVVALLSIILVAACTLITAVLAKLAWNLVLPPLLDFPTITIMQAWAVLFIIGLLRGLFSR